MSDQAALLESLIDFESIKIISLPQRIWIFGGAFDITSHAPISLRDKFLRYLFANNVSFRELTDTPENHKEWWNFAGYPDLLEFENDAGSLSQLIVLFSESAGAWTELGAFANHPDLCKRLLVVISEDHRDSASFVELGPIKRIQTIHPECEGVSILGKPGIDSFDDTYINAVIQSIESRIKKRHKSEVFSKLNRTHVLLLTADLANIFQAVRLKTIGQIFHRVGIPLNLDVLTAQAKLLHMLGLAKFREIGSEKVLLSIGPDAQTLVDYQGQAGKRFDRVGLRLRLPNLSKKIGSCPKSLEAINEHH